VPPRLVSLRGLQEFNQLQRGELNLGASQTIGNYWLPHFLSQFKRQYSSIHVNCTLGNTETIASGTVSGNFDLGLVEGIVEAELAECLEQQIVGSDRLSIVVGQSHPWFERSTVTPSDFSNTAWVMREAGSGTRQIFEQTLQHWGIALNSLNVILELTSGEMMKAVVESGIGATAISELMVRKEVQFGILKALPIREPGRRVATRHKKGTSSLTSLQRSFTLLKHKERFQTRISRTFEQLLATHL
jgi:DNA-binding transcriptional LysR family regulator